MLVFSNWEGVNHGKVALKQCVPLPPLSAEKKECTWKFLKGRILRKLLQERWLQPQGCVLRSIMVQILILQLPDLGLSIFERSMAESQLLIDEETRRRMCFASLCLIHPDPNGAAFALFAFLSPWQVWCTGRQGFFSSRRVWDFCHPPDRSLFLDSKYVVTGTDLDLVLPDPADLLYHSVSKSLMELWFRHSSFQASVCTPASHVHVPELKARGSYLQSDNKGPYWIKDLDVHQISSRVVLCFGHATKKAAKCSNRAKSKRLVFAVVLSAKEFCDTSMLQTTFDYSWSIKEWWHLMECRPV